MAMRPGSRGGFGATGGAGTMGGAGAMRPGTGGRGGMAVGTARMGTGRLGTGAGGPPVYAGVGLNTEVNVAERPVTQQGVMGMRLKSAGPGRQVQDQSYFLGVVREKNRLLTEEIAKLKGEIERFHKDNSTYQALERKYATLIKEVRGLEGQLADYNLAMDKARTSTDPAEITHFYMSLKAKNEHEAKEIDKIFVDRQERDEATDRVEHQIRTLQEEAASKMNSLSPEKREAYHRLVDQNRALTDEISHKQADLEAVNGEIEAREGELRRDVWRDEYARLEKQRARLLKERDNLREESAAASMDPAAAREKLLQKVKDDNAAIQTMDRKLRDAEDELARMRKTASDLTTDIEERKGEAGESHKYEVLYQRDQEMTEFIAKFSETREKELADQQKTESIVVALLEHMSKGLDRKTAMPTKAHHAEMQDDLTFKERQLASSETTHARLQQDLAKRHAELEKINTLDSKISVELNSLNEKIASMQDEMRTFANIDSLKAKAEETRAKLVDMKGKYIRRRDMVRTQVAQLSAQYERKKAAFAENETAKALQSLEQRLRHYEQNIFGLREYIETKGRETDYKGVAEECTKLTDDLNARIIKAQATMMPVAAATPY